ncbi:MAG: hypothetical protein LLG02_15455 [Pelosinus sp.]|nr:hypothetical protein [Pelosinus sp.]
MRILLFAAIIAISLHNIVFANAGFFTGPGYTLQLTTCDEIQMVSENVSIIPERGPFLFDGGLNSLDSVSYHCQFKLRNNSDKLVVAKVGFPINSNKDRVMDYSRNTVIEQVQFYNFIARAAAQTYNIEFIKKDKDQKFYNIFLWDMVFEPYETIDLYVSYKMPMSMGDTVTAYQPMQARYSRDWYFKLTEALVEHFSYITETGSSWSGKIEKADFNVNVRGFEEYLHSRQVFEESQRFRQFTEKRNIRYPQKPYYIFREISPEADFIENKDNINWTYTDYKPGKPIIFGYWLLYNLPCNIEQVQSFIKTIRRGRPTREDVCDLKEIIMAYMGVPPKTPRVEDFVKQQRWYGKKRFITEQDLSEEDKQFIRQIGQLIAEIPE